MYAKVQYIPRNASAMQTGSYESCLNFGVLTSAVSGCIAQRVFPCECGGELSSFLVIVSVPELLRGHPGDLKLTFSWEAKITCRRYLRHGS